MASWCARRRVRKYSRQYPVPTYVLEFLLGRTVSTGIVAGRI